MLSRLCLFLRASNWASIHASWESASWMQADQWINPMQPIRQLTSERFSASLGLATSDFHELLPKPRWFMLYSLFYIAIYFANPSWRGFVLSRHPCQMPEENPKCSLAKQYWNRSRSFREAFTNFRGGFSGHIYVEMCECFYHMRKRSKHIWTMSRVHNGLRGFTMYYYLTTSMINRFQMAWSLRCISVFDESI